DAFRRWSLLAMQLEESVGGIFQQHALPAWVESHQRPSPLIANLLSAKIRSVDRVRLRGSADEFLLHEPLMLEANIDIAPRFITDNATLQDAVAPFLLQGGVILAI